MSDGGGWPWDWSDVSGMAAAGTLLTGLVGWVYKGLSDKAKDATIAAADAGRKAEAVGDRLAAYQIEAVEKFVPRAHLEQVKFDIIQRIDQQDHALRTSFGQVTDRLDRMLDSRHSEQRKLEG